jgi:hypothetical protein
MDAEQATDLVVVLGGHDVFRGLVLEAGWPLPRYKTWLFTTLVQQLLGAQPPDPEAFEDLSFEPPPLPRS